MATTLASASSRDKDIAAQKAPKVEKANWLVLQLQEKQLNWE
jgi:hypothetical protein